MSFSFRFCLCRIGVMAWTGPSPICAGSHPAHWVSVILARGFKLYCLTAFSLASISSAAPSLICELLAAVTLP